MYLDWYGSFSIVVAMLALPVTYMVVWRLVFRSRKADYGTPFTLPLPEAAKPHWKGRRASSVDLREDTDPSMIRCFCPATGQLLGAYKADDRTTIDLKVQSAAEAQKDWQRTTFEDRRRVLNTILRFITTYQHEIACVACRDTGKTMIDAALGEIMVTLEKIKWLCSHGEQTLSSSSRPGSTNPLLFYKGARVDYQPLGVVCAMVSWNYPLHNLLGPVVAGIFAGNGVVVKCSEQVVWSSEFFVQIARKALEIEGFNPDLVQLVYCWPEHADALTTHPLLKHITFIGSRPVAKSVAKAAASVLTPVVAELGGKDALVVLDDISPSRLREVESIIMRGTFQSAGQNCIGVERVVATGHTYEKLETALQKRVKELRVGSSLDDLGDFDMGSLISETQVARIEQMVQEAVEQGAKLLAGGKRFVHPKYPLGSYFEPTMLSGVTADMKIAQEEVFGPVLLLMYAESTFDAVSIANSTEFALGASVFGGNGQLMDSISELLRAGNVSVNDFATYHLCQLPFGGVDGSGYGKFGGAEGLRGLCLEKSISYDRFPMISTFIPKSLDYPIPSVAKAWEKVSALNTVGYAGSVWARLKALRGLLGV